MTKKFTPSLWDLEHLLESTGYMEVVRCVDFVEQQVVEFDERSDTEFETRFVPQIRVSFLMALIARMEHHLKKLCEVLAEMRNLEIRSTDLKGSNGFESCVLYMEKVLQVKIPKELLAKVRGVVELRNALVHKGGYVDRLPQSLGAAKVDVRKGADGQILIGERCLEHAAELCQSFVETVVENLRLQNAKWARRNSPHKNKRS